MSDKDLNKVYQEVKLKISENKVIFGAERTIKLLKNGKIKRVIIAKNCLDEYKEKIFYYKKLDNNLDVIESDLDREELGKILGVPFLVGVVGVLK